MGCAYHLQRFAVACAHHTGSDDTRAHYTRTDDARAYHACTHYARADDTCTDDTRAYYAGSYNLQL